MEIILVLVVAVVALVVGHWVGVRRGARDTYKALAEVAQRLGKERCWEAAIPSDGVLTDIFIDEQQVLMPDDEVHLAMVSAMESHWAAQGLVIPNLRLPVKSGARVEIWLQLPLGVVEVVRLLEASGRERSG